ncbi:MAG: hypothetical protein IJH14_06560 [Solobacterium sp.]|nr:hypothetical protein [Solobacterium sp.]
MKYVENTLSIVFVGDFNRKYINFDWLSKNVFKESSIEMGVSIQDEQATISYGVDDIIIIPNQKKIVFQIKGMNDNKLEHFSECVCSFLNNIPERLISAYGINSNYTEEDTLLISKEIDSLDSQKGLVRNGFNLLGMTSRRQIEKKDIIYNISISTNTNMTSISINEDYQGIKENPKINKETFIKHFERTKEIIESFGFIMEESEDE